MVLINWIFRQLKNKKEGKDYIVCKYQETNSRDGKKKKKAKDDLPDFIIIRGEQINPKSLTKLIGINKIESNWNNN